ncbi:hypothetical protein Leryth_008627 [Lithospermum erythrorhizon]|nr:hypothetical protein Leryth_008627 [Lithospermum erythrorhizon]
MVGRRLLSLLKRNSASLPSGTVSEVSADGSRKSWVRRLVSGGLIVVTGGVGLSALDDLTIYHGCSRSDFITLVNMLVKKSDKGKKSFDCSWTISMLELIKHSGEVEPKFYYASIGEVAIIVFNPDVTGLLHFSKAMERASKNQAIIEAIGEPIKRGPWYNASLAVAHKRHSVSCTFPVTGPQGTGIFQLKAVRNGDDSWLSFLRSRDWEILVMEALLHVPGNDEKQQTFRISVPKSIPSPATAACIDCKFQPSESIDKKAEAS